MTFKELGLAMPVAIFPPRENLFVAGESIPKRKKES